MKLGATPHNYKYGPYSIRTDFLIEWSMSVDELRKEEKKNTRLVLKFYTTAVLRSKTRRNIDYVFTKKLNIL